MSLRTPRSKAGKAAGHVVRVLLIEDEPDHCELVEKLLEGQHPRAMQVECVATVADACQALSERRYGCVLLDHNLPDGNGCDVLDRMSDVLLTTPVIGLSTSRDPEIALADFRGGCVEFIQKHHAFKDGTLYRRVLDGIAQFDRRATALMMDHPGRGCVQESLDAMVAAARVDRLTGICNRAAYEDHHRDLHTRAIANGFSYAVALLDVDHFKDYNDYYGHTEGDMALKTLARSIQAALKDNELMARYGGEEFMLLIENTDLSAALNRCENLLRRVFDLSIPHRRNPPHKRLTISMGLAIHHPLREETITALVDRADEALYRAKADGRNRVVVAPKALNQPSTGA